MKKIVLLLLILPFYLNDFLFMAFQQDPHKFLLTDYGTRIFVLTVAFISLKKDLFSKSSYQSPKAHLKIFLIASIALTTIGIGIDQLWGHYITPFFHEEPFFKFPSIENSILKWIDLTFGLILVALSEEIVFRGHLTSWLKQKDLNPFIIVFIVSGLFGAIHWGSGINNALMATTWSILPTFFILRYNSIYPVVIAHFMTNFISFGNFNLSIF
ncbi:MAG: membrane protease YdiL (CAAX protease family) [Chlamydiales bacterium]|jgi:membrane protease YdiL (CAAX protease family)